MKLNYYRQIEESAEVSVEDFIEYFWEETHIVVARELTKKFEEFKRWTVREILEYFEKNSDKVKWEFVIIF